MEAWETAPWLVRIRRALDEPPLGAGMLGPDDRIVTCAHVVLHGADIPPAQGEAALEVPADHTVYVEFQHADRHEPIPAVVAPGGWHPLRADGTGDVAVLDLLGDLPPAAAPAPLRRGRDVLDHRFSVTGFPDLHPGGVPAHGRITGAANQEWIELQEPTGHGRVLVEGFSGSPVWDRDLGAVVGLVATAGPRNEEPGRARVGYATHGEALATYWAALEDQLDLPPPGGGADPAGLDPLLATPLIAGLLPRVDEVDPYDIGVAESRYVTSAPAERAYIRRSGTDADAGPDAELERRLAAGDRFLLLVGPSLSGKSRTAVEFLRRKVPGSRMIVPTEEPAVLAELARAELPLGADPGILWLDDLERWLGPGGMDVEILDRFLAVEPPVTVVATIQTRNLAAVRAAGKASRAANAVLTRAGEMITLSNGPPTGAERAEAARLYPDDDFDQRGIGEQLVAAPLLELAYQGASDGHVDRWAVVRAAVDWRRIGLDRPIPRSRLRELWAAYLTSRPSEFDPDDATFAAALAWARTPVAGSVALLRSAQQSLAEPDAEPGYAAFDYIAAYVDEGGDDSAGIPPLTWDWAVERLPPEDLVDVAFGALTRQLGDVAEQALSRAYADAETDFTKAWAAVLLGDLAGDREDFDEALARFEDVLAFDVPDVVPLAQVKLASLLSGRGEVDRAAELLEQARRSADPEIVTMAEATLGGVLILQGRSEPARELLESVLFARPAADAAVGAVARPAQLLRRASLEGFAAVTHSLAQTHLATVLLQQGEFDRAQELFDSAMNSGDANVAVLSLLHLGNWYSSQDDSTRAVDVLRSALEQATPFLLPVVQVALANVYAKDGDTDRSRTLLEAAAGSANPEQAPLAADLLGDLLVAAGDPDGAAAAYRRAIAAGHRTWTPIARNDLASLLYDRGDWTGAEHHMREVVRLAAPGAATALARGNLGMTLLQQDRYEEAAEELVAAADSRSEEVWFTAEMILARLWLETGELDRVTDRVRQALVDVDSEEEGLQPLAHAYLGLSLLSPEEASRHVDELDEAVSAADDNDDNTAFASTCLELGTRLFEVNRLDAAAELLLAARTVAEPSVVPMATAQLGLVRIAQHWLDDAAALLRSAVADGGPDVEPMARRYLGTVLAQLGRREEARAALQPLADSADRRYRPRALVQLGMLALLDRRPDEARRWLEEAIDVAGDDVDVLDDARMALADLLLTDGDLGAAAEQFVRVRDAGGGGAAAADEKLRDLVGPPSPLGLDPGSGIAPAAAGLDRSILPPSVALLIGEVAAAEGDLDDARVWLEMAGRDADPQLRRRVADVREACPGIPPSG